MGNIKLWACTHLCAMVQRMKRNYDQVCRLLMACVQHRLAPLASGVYFHKNRGWALWLWQCPASIDSGGALLLHFGDDRSNKDHGYSLRNEDSSDSDNCRSSSLVIHQFFFLCIFAPVSLYDRKQPSLVAFLCNNRKLSPWWLIAHRRWLKLSS